MVRGVRRYECHDGLTHPFLCGYNEKKSRVSERAKGL